MKMRIKETKPLLPFVSKEQVVAFDPRREETRTGSRVVDEVLTAIDFLGTPNATEVARYLEVEPRILSCAIKLVTGMSIDDMVRARKISQALAMKAAHPKMSGDELARAIGYCDHTALYHMLGRKDYDHLFAKFTRSDD